MGQRVGRARAQIGGCLAIAIVTAAVGCGGDDEGDSTAASAGPKFSKANEKPETFALRVAKLLETTRSQKDCKQLDAMMQRSNARFPCPPGKDISQSMASFEVVDAEDYGNGGVVDYKSGASPNGAALVLIVAPDRTWGISQFGVTTKPSVGTSDADSRDGYDDAANSYLRAVKARDCAEFEKVAFAALDSPGTPCSEAFGKTASLAELLRKNPEAKPVYEGGNAAYGFYSFETFNPRGAQTVSVAAGDAIGADRSMVMAVSASPTAAYQRAVIKEAMQQQRRQGAPPKSSSRKAEE